MTVDIHFICLVFVSLALSGIGTSHAQIRGIAWDENGNVVAAAVVSIRDTDSTDYRLSITDSKGRFSLPVRHGGGEDSLAMDTCVVSVQHLAYAPWQEEFLAEILS